MNYILLQAVSHDVLVESSVNQGDIVLSIWFYLSISQFFIILFLLWRLSRKDKRLALSNVSKKDIRKAKKSDVSMEGLMDNINRSRDLYKVLSRACHPDRFVNSDKQQIAEQLFQNVSENKRNYQKLSELKMRIETELNINLK